jgi:hypothetical protein
MPRKRRIGPTPVIETSELNFRLGPYAEMQTEAPLKGSVTSARATPKLARHERYDPDQNETGREHEIGTQDKHPGLYRNR